MAEQDSIAKGEGGGSNNFRWGEQAGPPDKLRYRFVCKLILTAYKVYASLKKHTKKFFFFFFFFFLISSFNYNIIFTLLTIKCLHYLTILYLQHVQYNTHTTYNAMLTLLIIQYSAYIQYVQLHFNQKKITFNND